MPSPSPEKRILNIVICGVGGQGTVLAGKLLAHAALLGGAFVRSAETIGMAQRGGSVLGHVRISKLEMAKALNSPLVPRTEAQLLIGFEPSETLKALALCAPEALVITATKPLSPPTASLQRLNYDGIEQIHALEQAEEEGRIARLFLVDKSEVMETLGFEKALNVVLLGATMGVLKKQGERYAEFLTYDLVQRAIEETVKPRFVGMNLQALEMGYHLP